MNVHVLDETGLLAIEAGAVVRWIDLRAYDERLRAAWGAVRADVALAAVASELVCPLRMPLSVLVIAGPHDGLGGSHALWREGGHTAVCSLRFDAAGDLLVGTADGVVERIDVRWDTPAVRSVRVREGVALVQIHEEPSGDVWTLSADGGVHRIEMDEARVVEVRAPSKLRTPATESALVVAVDEQRLALVEEEGVLVVLDLESGAEQRVHIGAVGALRLRRWGDRVICVGQRESMTATVVLRTGAVVERSQTGGVSRDVLMLEGGRACTLDASGTVRWHATIGELGRSTHQVRVPTAHRLVEVPAVVGGLDARSDALDECVWWIEALERGEDADLDHVEACLVKAEESAPAEAIHALRGRYLYACGDWPASAGAWSAWLAVAPGASTEDHERAAAAFAHVGDLARVAEVFATEGARASDSWRSLWGALRPEGLLHVVSSAEEAQALIVYQQQVGRPGAGRIEWEPEEAPVAIRGPVGPLRQRLSRLLRGATADNTVEPIETLTVLGTGDAFTNVDAFVHALDADSEGASALPFDLLLVGGAGGDRAMLTVALSLPRLWRTDAWRDPDFPSLLARDRERMKRVLLQLSSALGAAQDPRAHRGRRWDA
jgi:hypothetical protein